MAAAYLATWLMGEQGAIADFMSLSGPLVLADGMEYAVDRTKPSAVVSIAILTGATFTRAAVTAFNDEYTGLFNRDGKLVNAIEAACIRSSPTGPCRVRLIWKIARPSCVAK